MAGHAVRGRTARPAHRHDRITFSLDFLTFWTGHGTSSLLRGISAKNDADEWICGPIPLRTAYLKKRANFGITLLATKLYISSIPSKSHSTSRKASPKTTSKGTDGLSAL